MNSNPNELSDRLSSEINQLSEFGNAAVDAGNFLKAVGKFESALALLPEPVTEWEAATWLLTAIGESHFFAENYKDAYRALSQAMHCPGGIGNPLIHLRLGQVQLEMGNDVLAADELTRAYMGGGKEIFEREDPKYFTFIKARLDEPKSGW